MIAEQISSFVAFDFNKSESGDSLYNLFKCNLYFIITISINVNILHAHLTNKINKFDSKNFELYPIRICLLKIYLYPNNQLFTY